MRKSIPLLLAALAFGSTAIAESSCYSVGENAEFCGRGDWSFDHYMKDGVLFTGNETREGFYHMYRLRPIKGVNEVNTSEVMLREHAATFAREYQKEQYSDVVNSDGERFGLSTLEYEFSIEEWGEGNRTRLTFLIDGDQGYSFVTSGQAPIDPAKLNELHEAALSQFRLMGAE
ncbi:MAG: hypothetical protein ACPGGK_04760 [Pikeienuella sp.]